jgi:hypothetical protein
MNMIFGTCNVKSLHTAESLVTVATGKVHNEGLGNMYGSPSIIRIIKSRRKSRAGDVARIGEKKNAHRILV